MVRLKIAKPLGILVQLSNERADSSKEETTDWSIKATTMMIAESDLIWTNSSVIAKRLTESTKMEMLTSRKLKSGKL